MGIVWGRGEGLGGEAEGLLPEGDREALSTRWGGVKSKVEEMVGRPVRLELSDEGIRASGGAVLRSPDRRRLYDATFEARTEALREHFGPEVGRMLFGGE